MDRRARGAVFTPHEVGLRLVRAALDGLSPRTVCDPAAGDGRLLAIACAEGGDDLRGFGADLHERTPDLPVEWAQADVLADGLSAWPDAPAGGFDLVVGNPPFRGQLGGRTRLTEAERARLPADLGPIATGYADTAAMFLVRACEMAAPSGRVAMIMPLSYLASRDAAASRRRVLELATLEGLWVPAVPVFPDASVDVCAVVLDRSGPRRRAIRRWTGLEWTPLDPIEVDSDDLLHAPSWSYLAAAAFGVPEVNLPRAGRLGELVSVTAGFRDQFYGLAPHVVERDHADPRDLAPLITSGLIDPGVVQWGRRSARIAGRRWERPVVPLADLEPGSALHRWVTDRLHPKIVVATQTRVIEAAPDPDGRCIPGTPVLAAHADGAALWRALAVLLAPPISALALLDHGGTARSVGAIKLSARQVADLPIPAGVEQWHAAADLLRAAHDGGGIDRSALLDAARLMTRAYGCAPTVDEWWIDRLPAL